MPFEKNRKFLIIGAGFFLVVLILLIYFIASGKKKEEKRERPIPTITRFQYQYPTLYITPYITPTGFIGPTIIDEAPDFTGAEDEILPEKEANRTQQEFRLRAILPVETSAFRLIYDYQTLEFVVTIKPPILEDRNKFEDWLVNNGYDAIPIESFTFK